MNELMAALRPHLERTARELADPNQPGETASDIVQEAGLRAWQGLHQFRGGDSDPQTRALFLAWNAQIVRNVALLAKRARKAQRRKAPQGRLIPIATGSGSGPARDLVPPAVGPTPSAPARAAEQAQSIQAALDSLVDPTVREILRLCFFEGLQFPQIAARTGLTYDQVRERYHAGLRKLERSLKSEP